MLHLIHSQQELPRMILMMSKYFPSEIDHPRRHRNCCTMLRFHLRRHRQRAHIQLTQPQPA
jgi:hypothetical protein